MDRAGCPCGLGDEYEYEACCGRLHGGVAAPAPPARCSSAPSTSRTDGRDVLAETSRFVRQDRLWTYLGWADVVTRQEQYSLPRILLRMYTGTRRQAAALRHLPVAEAADKLCAGRAPWFREFATRRDPAGTSVTMAPSHQSIDPAGSSVRLPVA